MKKKKSNSPPRQTAPLPATQEGLPNAATTTTGPKKRTLEPPSPRAPSKAPTGAPSNPPSAVTTHSGSPKQISKKPAPFISSLSQTSPSHRYHRKSPMSPGLLSPQLQSPTLPYSQESPFITSTPITGSRSMSSGF